MIISDYHFISNPNVHNEYHAFEFGEDESKHTLGPDCPCNPDCVEVDEHGNPIDSETYYHNHLSEVDVPPISEEELDSLVDKALEKINNVETLEEIPYAITTAAFQHQLTIVTETGYIPNIALMTPTSFLELCEYFGPPGLNNAGFYEHKLICSIPYKVAVQKDVKTVYNKLKESGYSPIIIYGEP